MRVGIIGATRIRVTDERLDPVLRAVATTRTDLSDVEGRVAPGRAR